MSGSAILTKQDGPLLTVTLNRPEKANALTLRMLSELSEIFRDAAENMDLRAVIVTGGGDRVFSAGADLTELSTDPEDNSLQLWDDLSAALLKLPILSVAMLNGPCIGGGMTLALGCDIRIGSPDVRFQYPVLKNRVFPGSTDVRRLKALIGPGRMSSLLLGGQSVDAETALAWGLLDGIEQKGDLPTAVRAMTAVACDAPRENVVEMKRLCREG